MTMLGSSEGEIQFLLESAEQVASVEKSNWVVAEMGMPSEVWCWWAQRRTKEKLVELPKMRV